MFFKLTKSTSKTITCHQQRGRHLSLWVLICLLAWPLWANESLFFEKITENRGGPAQVDITAITVGPLGFLWIATSNGLNRYDGYQSKPFKYDRNDSSSLSDNFIHALQVHSDQKLWIGTNNGGLNCLDPETNKIVVYTHDEPADGGLANNKVNVLFSHESGLLFIGTAGGLQSWDGTSFLSYGKGNAPDTQLLDQNITAIYSSDSDQVWVGTNKGLSLLSLKTQTFQHIKADLRNKQALYDNRISFIGKASDQKLWIGTTLGLLLLDPETQTFNQLTQIQGNRPQRIRSVVEDRNGTTWIGTWGRGLFTLDKTQTRYNRHSYHPANPYGLPNNHIFSIYEDPTGLLWLGTGGGGLCKLDPFRKKFPNYRLDPYNPKNVSENSVRSFYLEENQHLWVGTEGNGLFELDKDKNQLSHYTADSSLLANNYIKSICPDVNGDLLLATEAGLSRISPKEGIFSTLEHKADNQTTLSDNYINTLYRDKLNRVWIGTRKGLDLLAPNGKQVRRIPLLENRPVEVSSILQDENGHLWVGFVNDGLMRLDDNHTALRHYRYRTNHPESISHNFIMCLHESKTHQLWVGTHGGGLNLFDPKTERFTNFTSFDGLSGDVIQGILEDEHGNLWISTDQGLSMMSPDLNFRQFDIYDGLQSNTFNERAFYQDDKGFMYFGGIRGFNAFHPSQIKGNPHPPTVRLTDIQIFNKPLMTPKDIAATKQITLLPEDYIFSMTFSALHFAAPKSNRYAFMMENYEEDWHYTDHESRTAIYTKLPPGHYKFLVKAANGDGVWLNEPRALKIHIKPPFYMTFWFRAVLVLVFILSSMAIHRIRTQSLKNKSRILKENNELLEARVAERAAQLEEAHQKLLEVAHKAGMAEIAAGTLHHIGNTLNSMNVSAAVTKDRLEHMKTDLLGNIAEFIDDKESSRPLDKGPAKVSQAIRRLDKHFKKIQIDTIKELDSIIDGIDEVNKIVKIQDEYANMSHYLKRASAAEVIDQCIDFVSSTFKSQDIVIERDYARLPSFNLEVHKFTTILIHIFRNAFEATANVPAPKITVTLKLDENRVLSVSIKDNGVGISEDDLIKIFNQGFSKKKGHQGYGLHLSANVAQEMEGNLQVISDGIDQGTTATFSMKASLPHEERY